MEIDIYSNTFKLSGSQEQSAPILSDFDFASLPSDKTLGVLKVIGHANENVQVSNLVYLDDFFDMLCEKVPTINELIFEEHFSENVALMLSEILFRDCAIGHLQLNRTKLDFFEFAPLSTLRKLSIKSAESWADAANPDIDDMADLTTLLDNNIHLDYVEVPERSYDACQVIINKRKENAKFRLDVVDIGGNATDFLSYTKTKLMTKLDSERTDEMLETLTANRSFNEVEVALTVGPLHAWWIMSSFLANLKEANIVKVTAGRIQSNEDRLNYELSGAVDPFKFLVDRHADYAGAKWTHLVLDSQIYEGEKFSRFGRGIKRFRARLPNLKLVDVRFIFQNGDWAPDQNLDMELRLVGKRACNGLKYAKKVQLDIRVITFRCTFEAWTGNSLFDMAL